MACHLFSTFTIENKQSGIVMLMVLLFLGFSSLLLMPQAYYLSMHFRLQQLTHERERLQLLAKNFFEKLVNDDTPASTYVSCFYEHFTGEQVAKFKYNEWLQSGCDISHQFLQPDHHDKVIVVMEKIAASPCAMRMNAAATGVVFFRGSIMIETQQKQLLMEQITWALPMAISPQDCKEWRLVPNGIISKRSLLLI